MSLLWFILAFIFFILWISSNSSAKRSSKDNYDKGFRDGRKYLADEIETELKKKTVSDTAIKKLVNDTHQKYQDEENAIAQAVATTATETFSDTSEDVILSAPTVAESVAAPQEYIAAPVRPARTKQQDVERNLNVLLYMASFLIVAAAAAFIATSMPPLVRLVSLWFVIVVFYSAGLILHVYVPYLRPAATAFIGTGLALIPFAGVALSQLGGLSGGWSWFVTSLIGIISYAFAALRLKSQLVSYLTIAFTLSLAASSVATFSGPIVLYFVVLIITSLVFHLLAHYDAKWVPELFKVPITQTSQLLTPVVLVGSLVAYDSMTVVSYQIVFWVSTLYYFVLWLTERGLLYETLVRVLISISVLVSILGFYDFDVTAFQIGLLAMAIVQAAYSLLRVKLINSTSCVTETSWISVIFGLLVMTLPVWQNTDFAQIGVIIQTSLIFVISIMSAYRFKSVYFAIPALITSVALPFMIGRWPGNELLSIQFLTWLFIVGSAIALAIFTLSKLRSMAFRGFIQAAFWVYIFVALLTSFAQGSAPAFIVSTAGIAVTLFIASYILRQWWIEILSLILVIPVITLTLFEIEFPSEWLNVMIIGFTAIIYAALILIHHLFGQTTRRDLATVAAVIIGGGLVLSYGQSYDVKVVVFFLALFYTVLGLVLRKLVTSATLRSLFTITYAVYPLLLLLFANSLGQGWMASALAITAATYWLASYIERVPTVTVFGNIAFIAMVGTLWTWLQLSDEWSMFGIAWISATVLYAASLVHTIFNLNSSRRYIHLIFTWILLAIPTIAYISSVDALGYAAAGTLLAIAGTIAVEGIVKKRQGLVEASIYIATLALQRIVGLAIPELNIVAYGHWWALTVFAVALWRKDTSFVSRLVIATAFVTFSTGIMALQEGGTYQILFLLEHIALLVTGALMRVSWALWWGLVASVLAVLYFLRSSLFLSLLFLGLTLLAIVIWRLIRIHKK